MVDYAEPDRKGEHIRLITSILDRAEAIAEDLARCYHDRWEAETGIDQMKTRPDTASMCSCASTPNA
ncbi:hypothetical protein AB0C14_38560 [Microbispora hainanensis]|uniref:hypothetical protein n=1 Tax=Microbispora hainanensis TaxID=568844 RepID=UPI0033D03E33